MYLLHGSNSDIVFYHGCKINNNRYIKIRIFRKEITKGVQWAFCIPGNIVAALEKWTMIWIVYFTAIRDANRLLYSSCLPADLPPLTVETSNSTSLDTAVLSHTMLRQEVNIEYHGCSDCNETDILGESCQPSQFFQFAFNGSQTGNWLKDF